MTVELLPREEKEDREPLLLPEDRVSQRRMDGMWGWGGMGVGGGVESTLRK